MKPIAWICLVGAVAVGTAPTPAHACSPDFALVREVTFDGELPDCLRISATDDLETLLVVVEDTCEGEVVLNLPEHDVESESVRMNSDGSTTVEFLTTTLLSDHFGETLEVPVEWTIDGATEEVTMLVEVVESDPRGGAGDGCGCSVSLDAPPSVLLFGLLGLGFTRGRRGSRRREVQSSQNPAAP